MIIVPLSCASICFLCITVLIYSWIFFMYFSNARRAAFEKEVVGSGFDALRTAVQEHSGWLAANCANQVAYYRTFAASRAAAAGVSVPSLPPAVSLSGEASAW